MLFLFLGKDIQGREGVSVQSQTVLVSLQIGIALQYLCTAHCSLQIYTLYQTGLSLSYNKVVKFKKNAAGTVLSVLDEHVDSQSVSYYLLGTMLTPFFTIDGKGTFHGMDMITTLMSG